MRLVGIYTLKLCNKPVSFINFKILLVDSVSILIEKAETPSVKTGSVGNSSTD